MKVGDLVKIADRFAHRSADPELLGLITKIDYIQRRGDRTTEPYYRVMFKNDYVWLFRENIQPFNQKRTKNVLDNIDQ